MQLGLFVRGESKSGLGASCDHARHDYVKPTLMSVTYGTLHYWLTKVGLLKYPEPDLGPVGSQNKFLS